MADDQTDDTSKKKRPKKQSGLIGFTDSNNKFYRSNDGGQHNKKDSLGLSSSGGESSYFVGAACKSSPLLNRPAVGADNSSVHLTSGGRVDKEAGCVAHCYCCAGCGKNSNKSASSPIVDRKPYSQCCYCWDCRCCGDNTSPSSPSLLKLTKPALSNSNNNNNKTTTAVSSATLFLSGDHQPHHENDVSTDGNNNNNKRQLAVNTISDLIQRAMMSSSTTGAIDDSTTNQGANSASASSVMSASATSLGNTSTGSTTSKSGSSMPRGRTGSSSAAPGPGTRPKDNVERLKSAFLSRISSTNSPQPGNRSSSTSHAGPPTAEKPSKSKTHQQPIEIPISSSRSVAQSPARPQVIVDEQLTEEAVQSPDPFLSKDDPKDRYNYASDIFNNLSSTSNQANRSSPALGLLQKQQPSATSSSSPSVSGSADAGLAASSSFGPFLTSLKKPPLLSRFQQLQQQQAQPGAIGIPITYTGTASTGRRIPNRPRSPARFADIGSLNVVEDTDDDVMGEIFVNTSTEDQPSLTAKRIAYSYSGSSANNPTAGTSVLAGMAGQASKSHRPSEEELDEKLQALSSRPRSRLLSRKQDDRAIQQPQQSDASPPSAQPQFVPISIVPPSSSRASSSVSPGGKSDAGESEFLVGAPAVSASPASSQSSSPAALKGEGTLERRIHQRNQLLQNSRQPQQQPATSVRNLFGKPSNSVSVGGITDSTNLKAVQKQRSVDETSSDSTPVSEAEVVPGKNDRQQQHQQQVGRLVPAERDSVVVDVAATVEDNIPERDSSSRRNRQQQQATAAQPPAVPPRQASVTDDLQKTTLASGQENFDRLDCFYEIAPPPSILDEEEDSFTEISRSSSDKVSASSAKRRRVRFNQGPIQIFNTFSAYDYDRRNEDVDPIAASAEYELEKLVERMEIRRVELIKGPDGLGLSIISMGVGANCGVEKVGIFVKKITEGGAAQQDGRILPFDFIIEVDGQSLVGVTQAFAGEVLRSTADRVSLTIGREKEPEKSDVVKLIKKSLEKEEKQAAARRDLEAEEKRLEDLKNRIRKSREEEERLDDEMKKLVKKPDSTGASSSYDPDVPCAPTSSRRFLKKDSSESPPRNGGTTGTTSFSASSSKSSAQQQRQQQQQQKQKPQSSSSTGKASAATTSPDSSASLTVDDVLGSSLSDLEDIDEIDIKKSSAGRGSNKKGGKKLLEDGGNAHGPSSASSPTSTAQTSKQSRISDDNDDYEHLYAKYKEVQYKNAVTEAELAKVKAKIILLENAECQRAHYEQKCDEMASRLRESERALGQAHGDLQALQTRLEADQESARKVDIVESECRQLERKNKKAKQIIRMLQSREQELQNANEALQNDLDQRERAYKRTIAVLNGQLSALESSLGEVQQMANSVKHQRSSVSVGDGDTSAASRPLPKVPSLSNTMPSTPTSARRYRDDSISGRHSAVSSIGGGYATSDADMDDDVDDDGLLLSGLSDCDDKGLSDIEIGGLSSGMPVNGKQRHNNDSLSKSPQRPQQQPQQQQQSGYFNHKSGGSSVNKSQHRTATVSSDANNDGGINHRANNGLNSSGESAASVSPPLSSSSQNQQPSATKAAPSTSHQASLPRTGSNKPNAVTNAVTKQGGSSLVSQLQQQKGALVVRRSQTNGGAAGVLSTKPSLPGHNICNDSGLSSAHSSTAADNDYVNGASAVPKKASDIVAHGKFSKNEDSTNESAPSPLMPSYLDRQNSLSPQPQGNQRFVNATAMPVVAQSTPVAQSPSSGGRNSHNISVTINNTPSNGLSVKPREHPPNRYNMMIPASTTAPSLQQPQPTPSPAPSPSPSGASRSDTGRTSAGLSNITQHLQNGNRLTTNGGSGSPVVFNNKNNVVLHHRQHRSSVASDGDHSSPSTGPTGLPPTSPGGQRRSSFRKMPVTPLSPALPLQQRMNGFMFNVYEWTCHEVENWLIAQKVGHLTPVFVAHRIDGTRLMKLTQSEMKLIGIAKDADRSNLKKKIRELEDVMKMERKLLEKERKRANKYGNNSSAISAPTTPSATTPVTSATNSPNLSGTNSVHRKKMLPLPAGHNGRSVSIDDAADSYDDGQSLEATLFDHHAPHSHHGNNADASSSRLHRFFRRK